jgi:mono/diheme cytochrome c family protein
MSVPGGFRIKAAVSCGWRSSLAAVLSAALWATASAVPNPGVPNAASPGAEAVPGAPAAPVAGRGRGLIAHGKYVAQAADCVACHAAPGGQPFAGGTPLKSPFGTLYGPNITPDIQTGIGSWTKADFDKALRLGIGKGGKYLYPAMPYDAYTKMTAADMDALWAYMRSIPAARNVPPDNTLPFPFTVRDGLAVWQKLYFQPGPFVPDSSRDRQWNRGAYLVQALAHCSDCHTPRNLAQGPETQHLLGGAQIEGWYAPDISGDAQSKLAPLSVKQLAQFLKTGVLPDNAKAFGPMQEAVHDSLGLLRDSDLQAIALYLKNQSNTNTPESATKAQWVRPGAGHLVYDNNCSSCHGIDGKGRPGTVPALAGNDAVTATEPYNVITALLEGFDPQQSWGPMASFADVLNDDQIADVANYVRTAWGNQAVPNATPWLVSAWRKSADAPKNESHALLCPILAADILQPALDAGPAALKQAAVDPAEMSRLVASYRLARPNSSSADVMEALSAGFCRAIAAEPISGTRMNAQLIDFAQRIAIVVTTPTPPT